VQAYILNTTSEVKIRPSDEVSNIVLNSEISGSYYGKYEDGYLLGCCAVW
jgi:hypothetical protein